jgi:hypothetical protein
LNLQIQLLLLHIRTFLKMDAGHVSMRLAKIWFWQNCPSFEKRGKNGYNCPGSQHFEVGFKGAKHVRYKIEQIGEYFGKLFHQGQGRRLGACQRQLAGDPIGKRGGNLHLEGWRKPECDFGVERPE